MIALSWVLGVVSVLGVGGAIAALIFFPVVAVPILQKTVEWLLGCKRCLYALAIVALALAAFWGGHHKAVLDCRADNAAAALRNQQLDLDIAHRAAEAESTLIKSIEDKASAREKKDDGYVAKLESHPAPACALDDNDGDGLSNYQSGAGNKTSPRRTK